MQVNKVAKRMAHEVICVHDHGAHATDFTPPKSWSSLAPELLNAKVIAHNLKEGLAQDNLVVWNTELPVSWMTRNEERLEAMCIATQRIAKQAEELYRFWEDQRDSSKSWQCAKDDEPPFCLPPLLPPTCGEFVETKVRAAITAALCNPDEPLNQAFSLCEGADLADERQSESESVDEGSSIGDRSASEDEEDEDSDDNSLASLDEEEDDDEDPVPPPKKQK